jgi:hypothetical protein
VNLSFYIYFGAFSDFPFFSCREREREREKMDERRRDRNKMSEYKGWWLGFI